MKKTYNKVLENGLRVYIVENKKKNRCGAKIVIRAGGHNISYIGKNGGKKEIKQGIAHFLEHYLIEKSIYGNLGEYFWGESMAFNGLTFQDRTEFYFSTVHDFKDALIRLIRLVNKPNFTDVDIEDIKKPIIEEIKSNLDNVHRQESKMVDNVYYDTFPGDIILGDIETIEDLTIDDLKEFHKEFYGTNNQILSIVSKYDANELLQLINEEYDGNNGDIQTNEYLEPIRIKERELTIINPKENEYLWLIFKISLEGYSNWEAYMLENYFYFLEKSSFGTDSKLFKNLRNNNHTIYAIDTRTDIHWKNKFASFSVRVYTSDFDKAQNMVLDTLRNIEYDEETFNLLKNNLIITYINRQERNGAQNDAWLYNYLSFDLDYLDDLEDIKKLNLDEMKKYIEKIDFTNYLSVRRIKKEENV